MRNLELIQYWKRRSSCTHRERNAQAFISFYYYLILFYLIQIIVFQSLAFLVNDYKLILI